MKREERRIEKIHLFFLPNQFTLKKKKKKGNPQPAVSVTSKKNISLEHCNRKHTLYAGPPERLLWSLLIIVLFQWFVGISNSG